jgi:hypothetical protein
VRDYFFLFCSQGANVVLRELGYALVVSMAAGLAWKSWQWNDKARRVENNLAWDKYYPIYAQQVKVRCRNKASHAHAGRTVPRCTQRIDAWLLLISCSCC